MSGLFIFPRGSALMFAAIASVAAATIVSAAERAPLVIRPMRSTAATDSRQMQNDLQKLPWPQFRSIIESIPKLKADVEGYGPIGWQIVKDNYRVYPWKRNIDKLDAGQKKELAGLIEKAKSSP